MSVADATNQYYPSEGINGYGSQLMVGNGASPEVFEAIAFINIITPGDMSSAVYQRTHLRSPDAHHEKGVGMRDSGAFAFTGTWVPSHRSQSNAGGGSGAFAEGGLVAIWRSREARNFKIVLADGSPATEWPFRGAVTKFQPGAITGDKDIDFSAEITPLQAFDTELP